MSLISLRIGWKKEVKEIIFQFQRKSICIAYSFSKPFLANLAYLNIIRLKYSKNYSYEVNAMIIKLELSEFHLQPI